MMAPPKAVVLAGALLLSSLPAVQALHHMKMRPQLTKRQDQVVRPLIVKNSCSEPIYPGISTQNGDGPKENGFKLEPGESKSQTVSEAWQGRVWGRTNCSFNADGTGPAGNAGGKACLTGDCGGTVACNGTGEVPVSLAEFTLDAGDGQTYYDISLVDGYNLPVAIVLQPVSNTSLDEIPPNLTNPSCVGTIGNIADKSFNPYDSGQTFLGTNSSFPLPFETKSSNRDVSRWCPWDLQVNPPTKPGHGVYPYPDDNIERPAFPPCFSACAKFNAPADCCVGKYGSPSTCSPSRYSKSAKAVCPDAYSYAFDDQTSTFIVPSGPGFEIVFCPGGRSTDILATKALELEELAKTGGVKSQRRSLGWLGFGRK